MTAYAFWDRSERNGGLRSWFPMDGFVYCRDVIYQVA